MPGKKTDEKADDAETNERAEGRLQARPAFGEGTGVAASGRQPGENEFLRFEPRRRAISITRPIGPKRLRPSSNQSIRREKFVKRVGSAQRGN